MPWESLCHDPLGGIETRRGINYLCKKWRRHVWEKQADKKNSNQAMDLIYVFFSLFYANCNIT
jgi:hypothetical protein